MNVLKALQQFADRVMFTRRNEGEAAFLSTKNEPDIQACATFEIVLAKATNALTRMKVRFPKTGADGIDCSGHFTAARSGELPNIPPKSL
jgi:hypothetical protein